MKTTTVVILATLSLFGCVKTTNKRVVPKSSPTDTPTNEPTNTPTILKTDVSTNTPTILTTSVSTNTEPTNEPTNTPTVSTNSPTSVSTNTPTNEPTNTPTIVPTNPIVEIPTPIITTTSAGLLEKIDPVFNEYCSVVFKSNSEVELEETKEMVKIAKDSEHLSLGVDQGIPMLLITHEGRIKKAFAKDEGFKMDCSIESMESGRLQTEEVAIRETNCLVPKGTKVGNVVTSTECGAGKYDMAKLILRSKPTVFGACKNANFPRTCEEYYDSETLDNMKSICETNGDTWSNKCPSEEIVGGCLNRDSAVTWFYEIVEGVNLKNNCIREGSKWVDAPLKP